MATTDTIEILEDWKNGHKFRSVKIDIDDGYGASCWCVTLTQGENNFQVLEVSLDNLDGDYPGLAETIRLAVEHADEFFAAGKVK